MKKDKRINVRANDEMLEKLQYIKNFLCLVGDKEKYSDSEVIEIVLDYVENRIKENNISPL